MDPTYPGLTGLYSIFETKITGAMCGTSTAGLISPYSPALLLIARIGNLETPNDGMVWYDSCFIVEPDIKPSSSPTSLFYDASVNHADSSCRNGDGWWGDDRQPCAWYTNRV